MSDFKRTSYSDKLRDPRWQQLRLRIFERDKWTCQKCGDTKSTLNVHHRWYERGQEPWDASDGQLVTLCEPCHEREGFSRPAAEARLLRVLRRNFLADDLDFICDAFHYMTHTHTPAVIAMALDHFLIETENVSRMVAEYQKYADEMAGGDLAPEELPPT